MVVSSWFSFLPGLPSVYAAGLHSAGLWRPLGVGCCLSLGVGFCLVVGTAWWMLLPRLQASPPWLPSWLMAPDGRQAPGGDWTAWTAFVQHCLLPDVGFCQVVGAACPSVLGSAWLWALLGGGCCLGLRLPLPGCLAGSWRLLAAGGCWRPLMAVRLLMGVGQLNFRVNIFFPHYSPCRSLCLFGVFGIFCRVVHLDGARTQ